MKTKTKRRKEEFRMPDGSITTSIAKYAKAWTELAKPFERATGLLAIGYDPGILFQGPFTLPASVLIKLNKFLP